MKTLGWRTGKSESFRIKLNDRGPNTGLYPVPLGPVISIVPEVYTWQSHAPPGTVFTGRIYVTEKSEEYPLGRLVGVYDHVEIPGKGKFPVCVVTHIELPVEAFKDDTAIAPNDAVVHPTLGWGPD